MTDRWNGTWLGGGPFADVILQEKPLYLVHNTNTKMERRSLITYDSDADKMEAVGKIIWPGCILTAFQV